MSRPTSARRRLATISTARSATTTAVAAPQIHSASSGRSVAQHGQAQRQRGRRHGDQPAANEIEGCGRLHALSTRRAARACIDPRQSSRSGLRREDD